jgi:hypothetical protein
MAVITLACFMFAVEADGRRQRLWFLAAGAAAVVTLLEWMAL